MKNRNILVKRPEKCPKCGEPSPYLGQPMFITIFDPHFEAEAVVLKGWVCENLAFGTVIRQGPVNSPEDVISEDHTYILDLPDREYSIS